MREKQRPTIEELEALIDLWESHASYLDRENRFGTTPAQAIRGRADDLISLLYSEEHMVNLIKKGTSPNRYWHKAPWTGTVPR